MNNLTIEKINQETDTTLIKITAASSLIVGIQYFYIGSDDGFSEEIERIEHYLKNFKQDCYIEVGKKKGKYATGFSLEFLKARFNGSLDIEVDLEIDNRHKNIKRYKKNELNRCICYVETHLIALEEFVKELSLLPSAEVGTIIKLNKEDFHF